MNEHQLSRLQALLKPFMLRRVKKDVLGEMAAKIEVDVPCQLSRRQQEFYTAIKNKISIADLLEVRKVPFGVSSKSFNVVGCRCYAISYSISIADLLEVMNEREMRYDMFRKLNRYFLSLRLTRFPLPVCLR